MIIYLIRGLPGSGKTTLARKLAPEAHRASADDFFTKSDGSYDFYWQGLNKAHKTCQNKVQSYMESGISPLTVDNTFVRRSEMEPYLSLAKSYDYDLVEVSLYNVRASINELAERCTHSVPKATIIKMAANWEH